MINEDRKKLYDALSSEYDLGTYEEFERNIGDSVKRRKLYDAASADYDLGDFESYSQRIGPTHKESLDAFEAEYGAFLVDFEERDAAERKNNARTGMIVPMLGAPTMEERQKYSELHQQEEVLKKAWYTSDEYLSERDAEALALSKMRDQIESDALAYSQEYPMQDSYAAFVPNPAAARSRGLEQDQEMRNYDTARRIMEQTIRLHNAPSRYENTGLTNFFKGASDKATDISLWTAGLSEITDNLGVRSVFAKVQDKLGGNLNDLSEESIENILTPAEKAVLQAWATNAQEQIRRAQDLSRGYQAGQGAVESLGYMAEFALTGGIGKATAEGAETLAKWLGKKVLSSTDEIAGKVVKETAEDTVGEIAKKYGKNLGLALAEAAGRTGVMPSTFRNISEKATEIKTDENGNNYLVGMNEAFAKGLADSFIENLSEGGRVNALGELIGDVAGKIPAYKKMVDKFSHTKASELWDAFNSSGVMNTLRAGGWHGLGEEYLEEWYGNALRTLTGVDKEALKDFATVDNQIVTLTSFLPMTIFGGTVSTAQVLSANKNLEKKAAALKSALMERGYNETQANNMIDIMRGAAPAEVSETLTPIVNSVANRNTNEAAALMKPIGEFAVAVQRWQSFNTKYNYQEQEQRDGLRAQMEENLGQFWQQDENGRQTVQRGVNEKGEVVYMLGKPSVEDVEAGVTTEVAAVTSDGRKVFVNPSEYQLEDELEMNTFLGNEIMAEKGNRERARMIEEKEAKIAAIRETAVPGTAVNIGTAEAPMQAIVLQRNPDGVIVNTPDGQTRQMTYEEFGNYVGVNAVPMTDAQIDEHEADVLTADRAQREAALDQEYENEDAALEELSEAEDEIEQAVDTNTPLPMKADGSVDQTALWNNDPERWAQWNDEQRQDGGANTLAYVNGAIAKEQAKIAELQAAYEAESDFDARDAIEKEIADTQARVERLTAIQQGYVAKVAVATATAAPAESAPAQTASVQPAPATTRQERTTESVLASLNDGTLTEEEIRANIDANLAEAQKAYDKYAKKAPKMGTDKDAYLAEKQKYEQGLPALQQEIDFWNGVKQTYETVMQQEILPTEDSFRAQLTKDDMEPQTPAELAARELGLKEGGIKLLWDSVKAHTGFGNGERQKLFGIFRSKDKGGMTIEAAGDRLMEIDREYNLGLLDQSDPMAGVNAILDVLGDAQTLGDLRNYIANNREAQVAREAAAAFSAMNADYEANHGMTMQEGSLADHVAYLELMQGKALSETQNNELNSIFAEEVYQNGTDEYQSETGAVSGSEETGSQPIAVGGAEGVYQDGVQVLHETQSPIGGGEGVSSEQTEDNVSEGNEQDGDTSVHAGEQADEIDDFPDHISESSLDEDMPDFTSSASAYFQTENIRQRFAVLKDRINEWSSKLGVKVRIMETLDDVVNQSARHQIQNGYKVYGFFDVDSGEVAIYLPDFLEFSEEQALSEIDKTYIHEVVSHRGLRGLLGDKKYGELCDKVWKVMTDAQKQRYINYPGVKGNTRAAADEFIAHFAENIDYADNRTLWDKIVDFIKDFLGSIDIPVEISNESMANLLRHSYIKLARDAKAATNANANQQAEGNTVLRAANGSLVGMHNISEEKLRKVIKQGGLANPSTAVVNIAEYLLDGYGEISLIMPSSLVDASTGDNVGTYTGDAWTPTYPPISRKINEKGWKAIKDIVRSVVPEDSPLYYDIINGLENYLEDNRSSKMEFVFLKEKGIEPEIAYKGADGFVGMRNLEAVLGVQGLREGVESYERYKNASPMAKRSFNMWLYANGNKQAYKELKEQIKKEPRFADVLKLNEDVSFAAFDSFTYDIFRKEQDAGKIDTYDTMGAAARYVDANNLRGEFEAWLESLMEQAEAKEVFFAGYTRNGERIYKDNTLENVSRHMRLQGRTNAYDDHGLSATKSALLQRLTSLSQIRKNKARLQNESAYNKEYDALKDRLWSVISQLADMQQISSNQFMNVDYAESRLQEAFTKRNPIAHLNNEYGYNIDPAGEYADELKSFIKDVQQMPAKYFETKFERPVYLNEFAAAVIPATTREDIKQAVSEAGLPIFEYDSEIEGSRKEATLKATEEEGIRFRTLGEKGAANLDKAEEATIRLDNLAVARQMEEAGKDAKAIKLATGWERGADKLWRYEVSDDFDLTELENRLQESLNDGLSKAWGIVYPSDLGDLTKAYPDFNVDIMVWVGDEFENTGEYSPATEGDETTFGKSASIEVKAKTVADIKDVLVHEIQHAIQEKEGFAEGGSVFGLKDKLSSELDKRVARIKGLRAEGRDAEADELMRMSKGLAEAVINNEEDIYQNYRKLAGEVEARNVSARLGMSEQERRESLLSETEDVAREDQIVLMDGLGVSEMGSRVDKRMVDIENELSGTTMSEAQKTVYNVFIGKQDKQPIVVQRKDGVPTIIMEQGADNKSGAKHAIFKHYGTGSGSFTAKDVLLIPEIVNNGTRKQDGNKVVYELTKDGVRYRVVTYVKTGNEVFNNFYTNRKNQSSQQVNAQKSDTQSALASEELASADKDTNNSGNGNTLFRTSITPEQDKAYMDAVEAGDMEAAQRMVLEAAKLAGYDSNSDYQGSLAFNGAAPSGYAYYDTKEERIEAWESGEYEDDQTLGDYKDAGIDISNLGWSLTSPVAQRMGNEYTRESIKNLADAVNSDSRKIKVYRAVDADIKEDSVRNGDWVTPSRAYAEYHIGLQDWKEGRIIEQEVDIDDIWWDGNDINEWGYNDGKGYAYKNTPNNRKLLAPVTYDDNGNVIPLSERFNPENADIRFRVLDTTNAELKEKPIKLNGMYRFNLKNAFKGVKDNGGSYPYIKVQLEEVPEDFSGDKITYNGILEGFAVVRIPKGLITEGEKDNVFFIDPKAIENELWDVLRATENYYEFKHGGAPYQSDWLNTEGVRFRIANENQAIFVSNAAKAVEGIKQEKATPEQWLKMIEKNGGLKAGEDKWMGLSDWLKASDKKTLTKQEVLDFINENMIQIEEVHYVESAEKDFREVEEDTRYALQEIYDDYIAESEEMNDDMYMSTHYDYAIQKLAERLGYDAWNAPFVNINATIRLDLDSEYAAAELNDIRERLGMDSIREENAINYTRLEYTTDGLSNKHEIALTVPTIESWRKSDMIHFGDAGEGRAIAWIRFGETKKLLGTTEVEGKKKFNWAKVLVIDEIQSKRHQEGREKGYISEKKAQELKDKFEKAKERYFALDRAFRDKYGADFVNSESNDDFMEVLSPEDYREYINAQIDFYDARIEMNNPRYDAVPDAPFDKNWHELAMKRMLRYAAENGYDAIAWTKGEQQAERYNIGNVVKHIDVSPYEAENSTEVNGFDVSIATGGVATLDLYVTESGEITSGQYGPENLVGKQLSDVVGKDLAAKILSTDRSENSVRYEGDNLRIGGEGMKGFYDKMLPAFMNKYGKKWGVNVEDIHLNLEGGIDMHSVPVTDAMKESIMEGQVMFRMRGENESAKEFTDSIVKDFKDDYNAVAPIEIVDLNSKEDVARFFNIPAEDITDDDIQFIKNDVEKKDIWAAYHPDLKKIVIFVRDSLTDSKKGELALIHENIHAINGKYPEFLALGEYLWNRVEEGTKEHKYKTAIQKFYPEHKWHDELSAYVVSEHMQNGTLDELRYILDLEHTNILNKILNTSGYGKERKSDRSSFFRNVLRKRSSGKVGRASEKKGGASELTAEERRIIGEYFPEFNKTEDVRYRMSDVNTNPTEAQKKAGNYKMGHIRLDGYNITIENPKGSVRRGTDSKGNAWENTLNNDYGYIRGTEGVDGDHIDMYLSDNPTEGNVFVIDQVNPETREFDEHKVMYGFNSAEEAREAYLANFSEGWNGLGTITEVSKDEFKKWIESSHRKTKPFSEYKSVKAIEVQSEGEDMEDNLLPSTGTPTDEVVANGLQLTPAQTAEVAANIFAALPEESRKKITEGLNGNFLGLKDAILQIPTSLAIKEEWSDEDKAMAEVVAEEMTKMAGEMTRPFSAEEGLWLLYNNLNKGTDLISQASRALVQRNLGFDAETLAKQEQAKEDVRFRIVGDANSNAQASLYNRGAANVWTRLKESYVDMMASVEELVKAIEKRTGKVAQGFENILLALNQQSSKGLAAMESYERRFLNPMFDEIRRIMDETKMKYEDVVRYVILKHGLERNKKLAQRDARAHYQEIYDDIISKITGMTAAQKRTYLTNAQLKEGDAKAELATLQAVDMSAMTDEEKREHKKKLAAARKAAEEAEEHLKRAQKIASMSEQEAQDELDKIFEKIENGTDSVFKEMRENDYSGISSMFYDQLGVDRKNFSTEEQYQAALMEAKKDRYSSLKDVEAAAEAEVKSFEGKTDTKELWKRINAATKETLRQQYEANMISRDQYLNLRDMFEYYVPLRGFKDNTAEDMYTYYRKPNSTGYTKPILGAEGRKTEAESPFGWIAAMAGSAIASNVKNEAKLALYYFVSNRPENGIATISKTWFVDSGEVDERGKKIFKPAYPPFSEDLSSAEGKAQYEIWQANMKELQKKGQAYEAGQRLNLGNAVVNISDANKPEHIVNVKVGGKDYTIIINGNPRAAQAINGDLNIETNDIYNNVLVGPWLRWLSSVNTSYSPEFWATNMMRDVAFTIMAVSIKGDAAYQRKFFNNYRKAFKVVSMVAKNEKGTLGNSYIENKYKDFVKYGGVTGYTQIKDSETWEKEIENYLKSQNADTTKAIRAVKDGLRAFHRFGESLEQVSRFAAFLTAVETGKSINEAINDAKEITVNFNRKGSGKRITIKEAKLLTKNNGQRLNDIEAIIVSGISFLAPIARSTIMFFNASVQALNAWFKLWKANKLRSLSWVIGYAAIGFMNALIHALLDDDDEYLDIPQYERRSSLMLGGNGVYFKWALPQEMSVFYALGELSVEAIFGRNPHQSFAAEAFKVIGDVLPVNIAKIILEKGGWVGAMPSQIKAPLELLRNEDYKGDVIFNDQKWLSEGERERTANWESAYKGTGRPYIEISRLLNNLTDNKDLDEAGWINIHPESLEHVVESMTGGVGRTVSKLFNFITAAINPEEDVTVKQTPFLNRFLTINDERYKNVYINDVYDYYAAESEHALSLQKRYTKERDAEALKNLRDRDEYQWAKIYSKYKKPLKAIRDKIKVSDGTAEKKDLMKQQDELKKRMIKEISEL